MKKKKSDITVSNLQKIFGPFHSFVLPALINGIIYLFIYLPLILGKQGLPIWSHISWMCDPSQMTVDYGILLHQFSFQAFQIIPKVWVCVWEYSWKACILHCLPACRCWSLLPVLFLVTQWLHSESGGLIWRVHII